MLCLGDTVSILVPPCTAEEGILLTLHGVPPTAADGGEDSGLCGAAARGTLFHFRVAKLLPKSSAALAISDRTEVNLMVRGLCGNMRVDMLYLSQKASPLIVGELLSYGRIALGISDRRAVVHTGRRGQGTGCCQSKLQSGCAASSWAQDRSLQGYSSFETAFGLVSAPCFAGAHEIEEASPLPCASTQRQELALSLRGMSCTFECNT